MLRMIFVISALIFSSTAVAQNATQYSCTVIDFNYFGDDALFEALNLKKEFLISVGEDQIYLTQTSDENNTYQMIYKIVSRNRNMSDVYANNIDTMGIHAIAISEFYHNNMYSATLTYHFPMSASVWKLDCQSQ